VNQLEYGSVLRENDCVVAVQSKLDPQIARIVDNDNPTFTIKFDTGGRRTFPVDVSQIHPLGFQGLGKRERSKDSKRK
jgi:hypothetical protein